MIVISAQYTNDIARLFINNFLLNRLGRFTPMGFLPWSILLIELQQMLTMFYSHRVVPAFVGTKIQPDQIIGQRSDEVNLDGIFLVRL